MDSQKCFRTAKKNFHLRTKCVRFINTLNFRPKGGKMLDRRRTQLKIKPRNFNHMKS